ncbi:MAG TPA: ATP-dependent DNA helicase [Streptosporangiaceae bacterium]|nr:ATP-dependent DNA helicase [Streptosporangiaceae bacterium]
MEYTATQRAAIGTLDDPLLIVACAGSGKTQVISQRIVETLRRDDVNPKNIVAFTFTEKAAAELKERVTTLVAAEMPGMTGLAELFIGTMHGYARDLLQTYVPAAFKRNVLDEIQARLFIDRNSRASGLTVTDAMVQGTPRKLKRYQNSGLYMQVLAILREDDVDESQLPAELIRARDGYRHLLNEKSYFDFTELLKVAVDLLAEEPDDDIAGPLVRHVRDHIRYVVVDEYQDTNPIQEKLIERLCRFGANLCVVGDDDQTIYQWRGSAVRNILNFVDHRPGVREVTLDENFRSSPGIVSLGRAVAELNDPGRLPKNMAAAGHQVYDRGDILALALDSLTDEARWICDRITRMRGMPFKDTPDAEPRGLSWSDFAVLFRSVSKDADALVDELKRRDIPYVIKGLTRLFDAPEVQACVTCFRYILHEVSANEVIQAWLDADLDLTDSDLRRALPILEEARNWQPGERWGTYNIQRTYLRFLEELKIREETIPSADGTVRGELVFYNLGKFSQAISDFEQIYFQSQPQQKYDTFVKWLVYQAPGYYAESDADVGYATPDAVTIATVHQAKGMQWSAVFVPALRKNRFPSPRQGGLNVFHVIPAMAVQDADRYRGTEADERRLFYVAVTRAQKYLHLTFAPGDSSRARARSPFFDFATRNQYVLTAEPSLPSERLTPRARHELPEVTLSFSDLKYFFECPYEFKLRFLYGFNPPIHEALGYGKSVHDVMAEVHKRAIDGDIVSGLEAEDLVDRHLNAPFAYPALREDLRRAAIRAVRRYIDENRTTLEKTLYSEQQIQVHVAPGITVDGRIDLIKRLDTEETCIVDFKSTERAQAEDITRDQLHIYAVGYQELTGQRADVLEVLNLDEKAKSTRELVNDTLLSDIRGKIRDAGNDLRANRLPRLSHWCGTCDQCDLAGLCRTRP